MGIKTRFAPSPTGYLHLGNVWVAFLNWLWTRQNKGRIILRIEDIDQSRCRADYISAIKEDLSWLGLDWDEEPGHAYAYGEPIQSKRFSIYEGIKKRWEAEDSIYPCFCSRARIHNISSAPHLGENKPVYDGHCRNIPYEEAIERVKAGEKYTIRLKVPKAETIVFNDLIRGRIEFKTSEIDDQVLLKSDGFPTYHGAIVIDDDMMKISHVMRGEEWISSIPKQVLTARAFGITLPEYAHLPNVLATSGKKLSKRDGDVSVDQYLEKGYLPEALLNFLALLGWHPKQDEEIMSMDEMIEKFEITDIHKAGAVLDPVKLDWMNGEYIKKMDFEELFSRLKTYLEKYQKDFYENVFSKKSDEYNKKIVRELQTRLKRFDEYIDLTGFFYTDANIRKDLLVNPKMKIESESDAIESLRFLFPILKTADYSDFENFKNDILPKIAESGRKNGQALWPLRVALSGEQFSPGAFELAYILGRDETVNRVKKYL